MQVEFWLVQLAVSVPIAVVLALTLARAKPSERFSREAEIDFLAGQIRKTYSDVSSGLLDERDAENARIEISRRLLKVGRENASATRESRPPKAATALLAILVGLVLVPGAIYLHWLAGAPGIPDMPLKARLANAEAARVNRLTQANFLVENSLNEPDVSDFNPSYLELINRLRAAVVENPGNARGLELLVQHESALGRYSSAADAQAQIINLKDALASADDYASLAELLVYAAGGYVSPEAEDLFAHAISIDSLNATALYYTGLMYAQTGRPDRAFHIWYEILESDSADANPELVKRIQNQIAAVAQLAGLDFLPPLTEFAEPDAATLTDDEQAILALGMVNGLEERLHNGDGPAAEWALLIKSLGVLGEFGRARDAWTKAKKLFSDNIEALRLIEIEARIAGIHE